MTEGVHAEDQERSDPTIGVGVSSEMPVEHLPPPEPLLQFGRYQILGRLAVGGMAEIFLAEEAAGDATREVVIKVLRQQLRDDPAFDALFRREGSVAMQLAHPNICTVYDFGRAADLFFIAMEHVRGATLWNLLGRLSRMKRRLPPPLAVAILSRVAAALDYAHGATDSRRRPLGVVHRDVSPHNIMVRFDGVVKLLDFGVAKVRAQDEAQEKSMVKGKSAYLSPEQCKAKALDGRSDVFALGICLFEALTGRRLYRRESQFDTFHAIVEEPPPDLSKAFGKKLAEIVQTALAKDPEDRFETAGDMQIALERWLSMQAEVITASRLRKFLAELYGDDVDRGPTLERGPEAVARLKARVLEPERFSAPPEPPPEPEPKSRLPWVVGAIGVGALIGVAFALAPGDAPPESPPTAEEPAVEAPVTNEPEHVETRMPAETDVEETPEQTAEETAEQTAEETAEQQTAEETTQAETEPETASMDERRRTMRTSRMRRRFVREPDF